MILPAHRLAAIVAGALLAAQTMSPIASAAPAAPDAIAPALITTELYQNACTAQRQSSEADALALAQGRPVDDNLEASSAQPWRAAFSGETRGGPVQPRYCWFSQTFGDSPGR